jgi:hypothetical protein
MITNTLSLKDLQDASEAASNFIEDHGDCGMSHEILMLFCFLKANSATPAPVSPQRWTIGSPGATRPATVLSIPEWFTEGVQQFAGKKVTASSIMTALGRPTDIGALREAGSWLRQLYGEPYRSGGQTLFVIAGAQKTHPGTAALLPQADGNEAVDENPYSASIPIASRVKNFTAKHQSGRFTVEKVANLMGMQGTSKELVEIGKALTKFACRYWPEDGTFDLSLKT